MSTQDEESAGDSGSPDEGYPNPFLAGIPKRSYFSGEGPPENGEAGGQPEEARLIGRFLECYESENTRRSYRNDLTGFFDGEVTPEEAGEVGLPEVRRYLREEADGLTFDTLRRRASTLSGFFKWLVEEGLIEGSPLAGAGGPRELARQARKKAGEAEGNKLEGDESDGERSNVEKSSAEKSGAADNNEAARDVGAPRAPAGAKTDCKPRDPDEEEPTEAGAPERTGGRDEKGGDPQNEENQEGEAGSEETQTDKTQTDKTPGDKTRRDEAQNDEAGEEEREAPGIGRDESELSMLELLSLTLPESPPDSPSESPEVGLGSQRGASASEDSSEDTSPEDIFPEDILEVPSWAETNLKVSLSSLRLYDGEVFEEGIETELQFLPSAIDGGLALLGDEERFPEGAVGRPYYRMMSLEDGWMVTVWRAGDSEVRNPEGGGSKKSPGETVILGGGPETESKRRPVGLAARLTMAQPLMEARERVEDGAPDRSLREISSDRESSEWAAARLLWFLTRRGWALPTQDREAYERVFGSPCEGGGPAPERSPTKRWTSLGPEARAEVALEVATLLAKGLGLSKTEEVRMDQASF